VRLALFLDLGDTFTKLVAVGPVRKDRARFPSAVASRLIRESHDATELLLEPGANLLRTPALAGANIGRTRSYARSESFVRRVRERPPAAGSRFAGRLAAIYGADRRWLGFEPSHEAVDALVHKALVVSGVEGECEADITFVLDVGRKAEVIAEYARAPKPATTVELRSYSRASPRRLRLSIRSRITDAPSCVAAALPAALSPAAQGAVLVIDIGFLRTKLAVLTPDGCQSQEAVERLGTSDLVQRILRDGQGEGLVEDEFAVIDALERGDGSVLVVAGRRFDVAATLRSAGRALEEEIVRAARRVSVVHFERTGSPVRAVAVAGGGAQVVGAGVKARLEDDGTGTVWLCPEPSWLLVEGARTLARSA